MDSDFHLIGDWEPSTVQASGVILQDHLGRILLQLRDINDRTVGSGLWSFFGGHVEGNESLTSAALREFFEETGVTLSPNDLRPVARTHSFHGVHLYGFCAKRRIEPHEIRLGEGAGFAFLTRDQIRALPMLPAAGAIIHHFLDNIDQYS